MFQLLTIALLLIIS